MIRPGHVTKELSISASTLRNWTASFADFLSPSAQSSTSNSGGPSQRRFTEEDFAILRVVASELAKGQTYEQVKAVLANRQEDAPEPTPAASSEVALGVNFGVNQYPIIQAFEEALRAKDHVISAKDETISLLNARIDDLSQSLLAAQTNHQPPPAPKPTFRWRFLNRLLAVEE